MNRPDFDLHIHTTASDGLHTPDQIVDKAVAAGLRGIAITDHDTVAGIAPALAYMDSSRIHLNLIPGIELNTEYKGKEVHILGYYIEVNNGELNQHLEEIRAARTTRGAQIVARLNQLGLPLSLAEVQAYAAGESLGRPHIARALVHRGYTDSVEEAFNLYLEKGKPAYVPRYKFTPQEAIQWVKKAGGISVLAHPGLIKDEHIVDEVLSMGIEGLEVFHPQHTYMDSRNYLHKTRQSQLLVTGGSDFHGEGQRKGKQAVGMTGINMVEWQRIWNYKLTKSVVRQ